MSRQVKLIAAGAVCLLVLAIETLMPSPWLDSAMQIGFGAVSVWGLRASGWMAGVGEFTDLGSPSLVGLAWIAPALVLLQMWMGTALRYGAMGPATHVLGAMAVGAYLLYYATGVMAGAPTGHAARTGAIWLLGLVGAQVMLGIAALVVKYAQGGTTLLPETPLFSRLHVASGTMLLGMTAGLLELLRHSARKPEAQTIV